MYSKSITIDLNPITITVLLEAATVQEDPESNRSNLRLTLTQTGFTGSPNPRGPTFPMRYILKLGDVLEWKSQYNLFQNQLITEQTIWIDHDEWGDIDVNFSLSLENGVYGSGGWEDTGVLRELVRENLKDYLDSYDVGPKVKHQGSLKPSTAYVLQNGEWKKAAPYVVVNGLWVPSTY